MMPEAEKFHSLPPASCKPRKAEGAPQLESGGPRSRGNTNTNPRGWTERMSCVDSAQAEKHLKREDGLPRLQPLLLFSLSVLSQICQMTNFSLKITFIVRCLNYDFKVETKLKIFMRYRMIIFLKAHIYVLYSNVQIRVSLSLFSNIFHFFTDKAIRIPSCFMAFGNSEYIIIIFSCPTVPWNMTNLLMKGH